MTEHKDLKVDPVLRDILETAAEEHYGQEFRAISRSAHEALMAWLLTVPDADAVDAALDEHDFDDVSDVAAYLSDGRFENDDQFEPLSAVRTLQDPNDYRGPGGDDDG